MIRHTVALCPQFGHLSCLIIFVRHNFGNSGNSIWPRPYTYPICSRPEAASNRRHIQRGCGKDRCGCPCKMWSFQVNPFLSYNSLCDGRRTNDNRCGHFMAVLCKNAILSFCLKTEAPNFNFNSTRSTITRHYGSWLCHCHCGHQCIRHRYKLSSTTSCVGGFWVSSSTPEATRTELWDLFPWCEWSYGSYMAVWGVM